MVEARDRLQASEKMWVAVAYSLKSIAERHGWPNESNSDLAQIAAYLKAVTGDDEITRQFQRARSFHTNFYEDEYALEEIREGAAMAEDLTSRLKDAEAQVDAGKVPPNGVSSPIVYHLRQNVDSMNEDIAELRRHGLTNYEAAEAARRFLRMGKAKFKNVSLEVGSRGSRINLKDGRLTVIAPKPRVRTPAGSKGQSE